MLRHYIEELAITGLTSNPTIFDHAIKNSKDYDDAIKRKLAQGKSGGKLFFELALEDLTEAADLFRPIYDQTCGVDGWVSLEVSPLLAHDTKSTVAEATTLHALAQRPNGSRYPAPRKGCPRSKKRYSQAYRSTSLCCSPMTNTLRPRRRSCAASNAVSTQD